MDKVKFVLAKVRDLVLFAIPFLLQVVPDLYLNLTLGAILKLIYKLAQNKLEMLP